MDYSAKLSHAIFCLFLGLALMLGGLEFDSLGAFWLMEIFGLVLCGFSFVVMMWIGKSVKKSFYEVATQFADKLAPLDPDQFAALGIRFPELRIRWNGRPILTVEDSGVSLRHFRMFIEDSDYRQVVAQGRWNTKDRPRHVWLKIAHWLSANEYVYRDSAAGSHSLLWRGSSRQVLADRYVFPTVKISRVPDDEIIMDAGEYTGPLVTESGRMQEHEVVA